jgi:KDO2-lipid IV(A) lauroyltransferase
MAISTEISPGHRIEAWAFDRYFQHFAKMPLDRASDAGAAWGARLGPLLGAHKTALNNLRLAFPERDVPWRAQTARAMWAGLGRTVAEFPHLHEINAYETNGRIAVEGAERLDAVKASGKGAVFISGHFSNWEIMAAAIVQRGVVCHVTYRPANNPIINGRIIDVRSHYGVRLQAAKGKEGGMGLLRALAKGETVALMNDQKYNEGVAAPLFGHDAMTADGPTRLAHRFKVPLIPMSVLRTGGAHFRVAVHAPIPIDYDAPLDAAIPGAVAAINAFMEARIRAAPEQWFWVHKRWPKEAWR